MQIKTCSTLNPTIFLLEEGTRSEYDCQQIITQTYAAQEDLKETPGENPEWTLFSDGSSFVEQGTSKAGYAIVSLYETIESNPLPPGSSTNWLS